MLAMEFCPNCANLLLVEGGDAGRMRLFCQTCPYVYEIDKKIVKKLPLEKKEVDDVLGGEDAWKDADRTTVNCDKCGNDYAYFQQIQIRSADEPMTTFYRCARCAYRWRQD